MENFQAVDKRVDFTHEPFHKNDFAQANAHVAQLGRETLGERKQENEKNQFAVVREFKKILS